MKAAFVVQRFGDDVIGGAESHALWLAEKLVREKGWSLDVFTTTAKDYRTWRHHYPQGQCVVRGVRVFRFKSKFTRNRFVFGLYQRVMSPLLSAKTSARSLKFCRALLKPLMPVIEKLWFFLQGPFCPDLIKHLVASHHKYQKIFFFTWLYYPTQAGIRELGYKSVLIPTAHDEAALWFPSVSEIFNSVSGVFVNSPAEAALIRQIPGCEELSLNLAGVGLSDAVLSPRVIPGSFSDKLPSRFLCFLGRINEGKGLSTLCDYFLEAVRRCGDEDLCLVLAGPVEKGFEKVSHHRIRFVGEVNENEKLVLLRQCYAVVNPSPYESLSLLVMEGLALKKPVLINKHNPVLNHYAIHNRSVRAFGSCEDFVRELNFLGSASWAYQAEQSLLMGKEWVEKEYSWERVLSVFQEGLLKPNLSFEKLASDFTKP